MHIARKSKEVSDVGLREGRLLWHVAWVFVAGI